jgi:Fuc2NAc and GlcNAc transferase
MSIILIFFIAAFITSILVWLIRRYALRHNQSLMNVPNFRSSHSVPTPQGGGLAFVISFLLFVPILAVLSDLPWPEVWAFMGSGILVSMIGFADDHGHVAIHWRLLAHFFGATWVLFWLGGCPPLSILGFIIDPSLLSNILAVFYLVWLLNLYNFMDGIDGLSTIETMTVCIGAALLLAPQSTSQSIWIIPLVLVASVSGFLFWNFPLAKIFMGDVGSGFLGLTLGIFSIQTAWVSPHMFWVWIILLGVFIVDASLTLLCRLTKGEKIYRAHNNHIYQIAARHYNSHKAISLSIGLINLIWLFPIAYLTSNQWIDVLPALVIAYTPLVGLFFYFCALKNKQRYDLL